MASSPKLEPLLDDPDNLPPPPPPPQQQQPDELEPPPQQPSSPDHPLPPSSPEPQPSPDEPPLEHKQEPDLDIEPQPTPMDAAALTVTVSSTPTDPNSNPLTPLSEPPMGVPILIAASSQPSSSRRLPPPCWTPDETSVLIDAYREKWYALRRGNLRAAHWQEVADEIHARCPDVAPPKTAVQCRHKMEKLCKRYRAELLRAKSIPHHRFSSSWLYFSKRWSGMQQCE